MGYDLDELYIDEEDYNKLQRLPEIEREGIISDRREKAEVEKRKIEYQQRIIQSQKITKPAT